MALPILSNSLELYFSEVERFPVLSRDEEHELALRYHEDKDLSAAHSLVCSNLKFVVKIALEFRSYGIGLRDLIQEGNIGLMTAVKKFNPHKGTRLITYASWWIKSFIQEYILKVKGAVKRSARALKKQLFYRDHNSDVPATDLSLDAPLGDGVATRADMLPDASATQAEAAEEAESQAIVKKDVSDAVASLSYRERLIIENRVMSETPESLRALGLRLGLTRERVRQIEGGALKKLKQALSGGASAMLCLPEGEAASS